MHDDTKRAHGWSILERATADGARSQAEYEKTLKVSTIREAIEDWMRGRRFDLEDKPKAA